MRDKQAGAPEKSSVVAIAQDDSRLKAVELRWQAAEFEVLWAKTGNEKQTDWLAFAAECGLSKGPIEPTQEGDGHKKVIAGFSSAGVVFNRIDVPAAAQAQTESIIRMQAESRLPLPASQMELAWRVGPATNGQMPVTMAAARTDLLRAFVQNVRGVAPARILLDCEGIVKAWETFFKGDDRLAVIVSAASHNSQVCLVQDGRLSNAVVLDLGADDFASAPGLPAQTEATERFVQDMRSVLALFGCAKPTEMPLVVLSDGGEPMDVMVGALKSAGFNASVALPDLTHLTAASQLDAGILYEYRVPIGLGLVAIEERADDLDMFERLYTPLEKKDKKPWFYSPKLTAALAAAMLVVLAFVAYAVDMATPGAIDKRVRAALSDADMVQLRDRQNLRKAVAGERPDILELIKFVNEAGQNGIKLDGVHFRKGQLVSVTGEAQGNEQLYKFEETLNNNKHIKDAKIQNPSLDQKTKKIKFSVTFKYKTFSEKTAKTTL